MKNGALTAALEASLNFDTLIFWRSSFQMSAQGPFHSYQGSSFIALHFLPYVCFIRGLYERVLSLESISISEILTWEQLQCSIQLKYQKLPLSELFHNGDICGFDHVWYFI